MISSATEKTNGTTESVWLDAIIRSVEEPNLESDGIKLPTFPSVELQRVTTNDGASIPMLRSAHQLYSHVLSSSKKHGLRITQETKLLDFGCGWGRIARFFLKDIHRENVYGVDVLPELVSFCSDAFETDNFATISQNGMLPFESNYFDIIFANSVFSHLTPELNMHWVEHIYDALRPGGLAALTIIDESHYKSMIKNNEFADWMNRIGLTPDSTNDHLLDGQFLWASTNRKNELEGYGIALIPLSWIEKNWTQFFVIREVIQGYSQAIVILEKPE